MHLFPCAGLQITVSHWTMADQNLSMSGKVPTVVGRHVWPIFIDQMSVDIIPQKNLHAMTKIVI